MRNNIVGLAALVVSFAFAGTALADGAATFKAKCVACHGAKGEGMKGMAPALKGVEFVTKGKADDVKKVIVDGRAGAAKKFKEYAIDMPKSGLSDADATELVKFLQDDLQK